MVNILLAERGMQTRTPRIGFFSAAPQRMVRVSGLTKSQAEDLFDWLEANDYREYQLSYTAGKGFTVAFSPKRGRDG
jgi:hypothetical protein